MWSLRCGQNLKIYVTVCRAVINTYLWLIKVFFVVIVGCSNNKIIFQMINTLKPFWESL